jgi:hypothetical protein
VGVILFFIGMGLQIGFTRKPVVNLISYYGISLIVIVKNTHPPGVQKLLVIRWAGCRKLLIDLI